MVQIGDVSRVLGSWRGAGAVLLNSDWWASDFVPPEHAAFVNTFEPVYSFVPLEVKASGRQFLLVGLMMFSEALSCYCGGSRAGRGRPGKKIVLPSCCMGNGVPRCSSQPFVRKPAAAMPARACLPAAAAPASV